MNNEFYVVIDEVTRTVYVDNFDTLEEAQRSKEDADRAYKINHLIGRVTIL